MAMKPGSMPGELLEALEATCLKNRVIFEKVENNNPEDILDFAKKKPCAVVICAGHRSMELLGSLGLEPTEKHNKELTLKIRFSVGSSFSTSALSTENFASHSQIPLKQFHLDDVAPVLSGDETCVYLSSSTQKVLGLSEENLADGKALLSLNQTHEKMLQISHDKYTEGPENPIVNF